MGMTPLPVHLSAFQNFDASDWTTGAGSTHLDDGCDSNNS